MLKQRSSRDSDSKTDITPGDVLLSTKLTHVIFVSIGRYDSELDKALIINFESGKFGFGFINRKQKQKEIHSA